MNILEILGKIDSYIILGILLPILFTLTKRHIAVLKDENKALKEQNEVLNLFRISGVEKEVKVMKRITERTLKERDKLRRDLQEQKKQLPKKGIASDRATLQLIDLLGELAEDVIFAHPGHSVPRRLIQRFVRIKGPVGDFWKKRYKKEEWLGVDDDLSRNPLWKG